MFITSCMHQPLPFDETAWRRQVENQQVENLYAVHYRDGKFFNPWMPREHGGWWRFWQWKLSAKGAYSEEEKAYLPRVVPSLKDRIKALPTGDFLAWIGHSTYLLRLQGIYWLIDPMFSERALLPKRLTPPALTGAELKEITAELNVLISHNHYDHLDKESIRGLPEKTRFFVPLGLKGYVAALHKGEVRELDWWQESDAPQGQKVICLPAQHWSRRIGQDVNTTLWASFLLATPGKRIYYGGDSGYFAGFKEFGRKFPPIDYALVPTTAYQPRWFMHYAHMDIPEALAAFHDLGARFFIPTQWGTFALGDEPAGYPELDLKRHIKDRRLDPAPFLIMDIGQIVPLLTRKER